MRVIAGTAGRIKLDGPNTRDTRPMTDRAKEAVIDSMAVRLPDARVLDLYAGSGSLAIEALSRGAGSAVLVEKSAAALRTIAANLARTGFGAVVKASTVEEYLDKADATFDVVFIDAPWSLSIEDLEPVVWKSSQLLADDGVVIVSRYAKDPLPRPRAGLRLEWDRRYGDSRIGRYVKETP
jgi:16S rRNA (guanine966-N2)-methyltransferase